MAGPSDRGGTHPQGTRFPEGSQQSSGSGTHSGTSRVGDVLGQVKEGAQHLASEASRQAGQAWESVQQGASAVADRAQDFWTGTQDLIRRYPVASVAIAFGAGCLFAGLFTAPAAFSWGESMPDRMSRYSA
jgi:ElaB/YqjD/DUF883 family membrane-anchored ribosome-binding protein